MKKEKSIDMSQYRYDPEDKRKLELDEIIWKMWDFRLLFIITLPSWLLWVSFVVAFIVVCATSDVTATELVVFSAITLAAFLIPLGAMMTPVLIVRFMNEKNIILKNAYKYLSNVGDDFLEQLQTDLNKGLPFMKKRNLVISERYVIGSITYGILDPIAIPKEQIREIAYANYTVVTIKRIMPVQEVFFRLENGKEISLSVSDPGNLGLTLRALEDCGAPIIDISHEREYGR